MGGLFSSPENTRPPSPPPPRPLTDEPWRKLHDPRSFINTGRILKEELERFKTTRLNVVLIGHTGAGKSTLMNSIFSVSRRRIVRKEFTKDDNLAGVGSYQFVRRKAKEDDLFQNVHFFDTMGFTGSFGDDDDGISNSDLKAVCEGRFKPKQTFNQAKALDNPIKKYKAHCIIFVVGAEEIDRLSPAANTIITKKLMSLYKVVPKDVARIAVITKIDRVCDETARNISVIYRSKKVLSLVKKVTSIFGVQENEVFPIVNFVSDMMVGEEKSVPILYAMMFALNYAYDTQEDEDDSSDED